VHIERESSNLNECVALAVINFQDGCHVSTAITIIRCTEYGHHFLFLSQGMNVSYTNRPSQTTPQNKAKFLHDPSYILP
jgi:hypothetical protein